VSDLLIAAAREIHSGPGHVPQAGGVPRAPRARLSHQRRRERYYKSGGQFLYKRLPFWLASLVDRVLASCCRCS